MSDRRDAVNVTLDPESTPASMAKQLAGLHPADIASALDRLDAETTARVLGELDTETEADVIIHLEEHTREDVLEILRPPEIADITTELDSDDAADVVGALDGDKQAEVLSELDPDERRDLEELLKYTDESAGGIMASEVVYVSQDATVENAIETVRAAADEVDEIHNVYVTDRGGRLTGVLSLRDLVLARRGARVSDAMNADVVSVSTELDQEEVADVFRKYDLVAVPVVDPAGKLIGRITVDDIIDVIHEEADEDFSLMAGTSEEEIHEDSVLRVSRIRLPWLVIGALGGIASATVMSLFQISLEKVLALAFFVPVITAMGGNVGLQTSTIIVRSMRSEHGLIEEGGSRLLREWRIALMNALVLGAAVLLIVGLWLSDLALAAIVGGSLATVILVAATLGTVMPFALRRVGVDPAVAQGPFVTTLNDILGILVYLGLASAFIDRLG
jgi:magnesium transporter